jgi:AAA domain
MADTYTAADLQASTNGHLPPGVTWTKVLEVVVASEDDSIFTLGLIQAVAEAGNGCLFEHAIQQRCARIRVRDPALYHGKLLELISASMPQRWRDWDHDIAAIVPTTGTYPLPESATALLAKTFPPLRCFVGELLAEGFTLLAGKPKKGKSYLALDMSLSIAVGRQAFMKFATEKAKVLYVSLEDGERRLQRRLLQIQSNLRTPQGLDFLYTFPRLGDGALEALAHYAQQYQVIIIDTVGRILPAQTQARKSLSEYQELTDVLGPIQQLALEKRIAIVMIDHLRKASADDDLDAIMGSQGKAGAADHALIYSRKGEEKDGVLKVFSRDLETDKVVLTLVDGHLEFLGKGEVYELDSEQNKIITILEEEARPMGIVEVMKAMGIPGDTHYHRFRKVLQRLYADDRIGKTKRGLYRLYGDDREEGVPF